MSAARYHLALAWIRTRYRLELARIWIRRRLIRNAIRQRREIRQKLEALTDPGLLDRIK